MGKVPDGGGIVEHGPTGLLSDATFEQQMDINVRGVWYTTSAAVTAMRDGERIINIGSFFSERMPAPGTSAYNMTKHAVAGLTKGWARDLAARQITVNTVEPRPIKTKANPDEGDCAAMIKTMVPLGRYGQPREVAELVAFLISAMSEMDLLTAARNYLKKLYQENHGVTARSGLLLGRVVNEVVRRLRKLKPCTGDSTKRFT